MITYICGYCGRPCGVFVMLNNVPYHEECTHGPSYQRQVDAPRPTVILTENRVREIVRQEMLSAKG